MFPLKATQPFLKHVMVQLFPYFFIYLYTAFIYINKYTLYLYTQRIDYQDFSFVM